VILTFLFDDVADGDEAGSSVDDVDLGFGRSVDVDGQFAGTRLLCVDVELICSTSPQPSSTLL